MDNENAVAIVKNYAKQINKLARRCDVIIPIHRSSNMREHTFNMLQAVKFNSKIRVGILCLSKKDCDLALDLPQIDTLLSVKNPDGNKAISKIHFLGMSDSTPASKLNPRLLLARLHGLHSEAISLDACRTTATFGSPNSTRKGSIEINRVQRKHQKAQVIHSHKFCSHTYYQEQHSDTSSGFVTESLYDLINEYEIDVFWEVFNEAMRNNPMMQIENDFEDVNESMEMAWQLTSQKCVDVMLFDALKLANWEEFKHFVKIAPLEVKEARFEVIKNLFQTGKSVPVQLQLCI